MKQKWENSNYSWSLSEDGDILGYYTVIRSREEEQRTSLTNECFEEWHKQMSSLFANLPVEQFQKSLSHLMETNTAPDDVLVKETVRNWNEIVSGEYLFDRHVQVAKILSNITQSELLQFYRDTIAANERKLTIQYIGYSKKTGLIELKTECDQEIDDIPEEIFYAKTKIPNSVNVIENIDEFKKSLEVYLK